MHRVVENTNTSEFSDRSSVLIYDCVLFVPILWLLELCPQNDPLN